MRFSDIPKGVHMKKIDSRLLIVLSVLLMLFAACNMTGGAESPPDNNLLMSTDLPAPTVSPDIPTSTASSVPTDIPTSTVTPTVMPQASPPPCDFTNDISLPLSRDVCARNSDLKLISSDGKKHTCAFTGTTNVTVSITQGNASSSPFTLDVGNYTLKCDNLPKSIKVSVN